MRWDNFFAGKRGVQSQTHRRVVLASRYHSNRTDLRQLRKFVKSLEGWPDNATVQIPSGAMLAVSFVEDAPDLLNQVGEEEQ